MTRLPNDLIPSLSIVFSKAKIPKGQEITPCELQSSVNSLEWNVSSFASHDDNGDVVRLGVAGREGFDGRDEMINDI